MLFSRQIMAKITHLDVLYITSHLQRKKFWELKHHKLKKQDSTDICEYYENWKGLKLGKCDKELKSFIIHRFL